MMIDDINSKHLSGFKGNPFDQGSAPDFNIEQYIRHQQNLIAENPEEISPNDPFSNYLKELDVEDSLLTSQTFSVQADREY